MFLKKRAFLSFNVLINMVLIKKSVYRGFRSLQILLAYIEFLVVFDLITALWECCVCPTFWHFYER